MPSPFEGYEVEAEFRPSSKSYQFDLDRVLSSIVAVETWVPQDGFTAKSLGVERIGNGVVIGSNGLVLTIGYLLIEAERVMLTLNDGRRVPAHVLGSDAVTGFGLVQALEPLDLPALPLGDSRKLKGGASVLIAGAGGREHAAEGAVLTRMPFAGYWEYYLENAIITEPAHPHWSGAALIGATGELVGIGSLSLERESRTGPRPINMFVPTELLAPILDDLARGRAPFPPRPWLGVLAQEFEDSVVVVGVSEGGPASRAELKAGDTVVAVAGEPVSDLAEFYAALWRLGEAGVTIPLRLEREGDVFDVEVRSMDRTALLRKPRFN